MGKNPLTDMHGAARWVWTFSLIAICAHANSSLTVQLKANTNVDVSQSNAAFRVTYIVSNPTSEPVKLLKRNTPLEGMISDMFLLQNAAGEVMTYRGKSARRVSTPSDREFISIKAGSSVEKQVTIGGNYQLDGDGSYTLSVRPIPSSGSLDVSKATIALHLTATEQYEQRYAEAAAEYMQQRRYIATTDCTDSHRAELTNWEADARTKINNIKNCTLEYCGPYYAAGDRTLVDTWFGSAMTASQLTTITDQFNTMSNLFDQSKYTCEPDVVGSDGCNGNVFAYVYPNDATQTIYMCEFTFSYPDYAEKVQTVIHELSHFDTIGGTNDEADGEEACYNLVNGAAASDATKAAALKTADTWAYFAVYSSICYAFAPTGYEAYVPPCKSCPVGTMARTETVCGATSAPTGAPTVYTSGATHLQAWPLTSFSLALAASIYSRW